MSIILIFLLLCFGFIVTVESEQVNINKKNLYNYNDVKKYSTGLIKQYDENGYLISNPIELSGDPPNSWDWRYATYKDLTGDWTTKIRDQGYCGSCWAFGLVASLEAVYNIQNGNPNLDIDLSEQFIVSCPRYYGYSVGDCCGGFFQNALDFVRKVGTTSEFCFPYKAIDANGRDSGDCRGFRIPSNDPVECSKKCEEWESYIIKVDSYNSIISLNSIKNAIITYGPVITAFDVYADFYDYNGGIYKQNSNIYTGGHIVAIVGYNDNPGYWICKNSWGTDWGENGWFKIAYGECNIGSAGGTVYINGYNKKPKNNLFDIYQNLIQQSPVFQYILSILRNR